MITEVLKFRATLTEYSCKKINPELKELLLSVILFTNKILSCPNMCIIYQMVHSEETAGQNPIYEFNNIQRSFIEHD